MVNAVIDAILSRRSIRQYSDKSVSDKDLKTVLEAGIYAPTAMNLQDPLIVAVTRPDIRSRLSDLNALILGTKSDPYYGAPVIVLVFIPNPSSNPNSIQDGSLVLGNMMLAAHALGLASCWINRVKEMFLTPDGERLKRELGIPTEYVGLGSLALGYAEGPEPEPKSRKKNYYTIIR